MFWIGQQSPDLNKIENLWSILDSQLEDRSPFNEEELFEVLCNGWRKLSTEFLNKLVESIPRRCKAVITSKCMPKKY